VTAPADQQLEETPDRGGAFPRLTDEQIGRLEPFGERRRTSAGELLFREGDERYEQLHVVLDGRVRVVVGHGTEDETLVAVHGRGRFLGELNLLTGQAVLMTAEVVEPGEVLQVPVERLRDVLVNDPVLGDLLLRAYIARRELLMDLGGALRIIGSRFDPETRRLREFAIRNRLPHTWIDLEQDGDAETLLRQCGVLPEETPVVVWRERVLRRPGNADVARMLGLRVLKEAPDDLCDLVVVGAGPAGLAATVYGASEGLDTMSVDGVATGGQAATSSRIENYLGFPAGISGAELADRAVIQAEKFGARISVPASASALEQDGGHHVVRLDDGTSLTARTVVIATGARYRRLPVPGLEDLEGYSVHYAATQMEARMCAGDPIAIVGGGNSAGQATVFLSRYVPQVHLIVRGDDLGESMSRYLIDRIERLPNVDVRLRTEVREVVADGALEAVVVERRDAGGREEVAARALFVFIGAEPHTTWLADQLAVDDRGFVLTGRDAEDASGAEHRALPLETSRAGVFAVGDVRSGSIKRMASAVGEGSMAVRLVHEHLQGRERQGAGHVTPQTYVSSK
jgi:thioredoxin reductase (NADPH)